MPMRRGSISGARRRVSWLFRFIEIPPKGARPLSKGCVSLSSSLYNIWGTQRKERHKFNFPPPANWTIPTRTGILKLYGIGAWEKGVEILRCIPLQGLRFGEGLPKLCVPLTGNGMPALLSELQQVADLPADLFEWRLDCFFGKPPAACCLRFWKTWGTSPCCARCAPRGRADKPGFLPRSMSGAGGLAPNRGLWLCGYRALLRGGARRPLAELAKSRGISVVLSKHDFHQTPPKEEIAATLRRMKALGADLPKYAVMPRTPGDVLACSPPRGRPAVRLARSSP